MECKCEVQMNVTYMTKYVEQHHQISHVRSASYVRSAD